jgi:hypothetical protein
MWVLPNQCKLPQASWMRHPSHLINFIATIIFYEYYKSCSSLQFFMLSCYSLPLRLHTFLRTLFSDLSLFSPPGLETKYNIHTNQRIKLNNHLKNTLFQIFLLHVYTLKHSIKPKSRHENKTYTFSVTPWTHAWKWSWSSALSIPIINGNTLQLIHH